MYQSRLKNDLSKRKFFIKGEQLEFVEDRFTEFKDWTFPIHQSPKILQKFKQVIASFLNTLGGRLYIGIDDESQVKGVPTTKLQYESYKRLLIDTIRNEFHPNPLLQDRIEIINIPVFEEEQLPDEEMKDFEQFYIKKKTNRSVWKIVVSPKKSNCFYYNTSKNDIAIYRRGDSTTEVIDNYLDLYQMISDYANNRENSKIDDLEQYYIDDPPKAINFHDFEIFSYSNYQNNGFTNAYILYPIPYQLSFYEVKKIIEEKFQTMKYETQYHFGKDKSIILCSYQDFNWSNQKDQIQQKIREKANQASYELQGKPFRPEQLIFNFTLHDKIKRFTFEQKFQVKYDLELPTRNQIQFFNQTDYQNFYYEVHQKEYSSFFSNKIDYAKDNYQIKLKPLMKYKIQLYNFNKFSGTDYSTFESVFFVEGQCEFILESEAKDHIYLEFLFKNHYNNFRAYAEEYNDERAITIQNQQTIVNIFNEKYKIIINDVPQ